MSNPVTTPTTLRARWTASSSSQKIWGVIFIALSLAIVVFAIVPLIHSVFEAGQRAVR